MAQQGRPVNERAISDCALFECAIAVRAKSECRMPECVMSECAINEEQISGYSNFRTMRSGDHDNVLVGRTIDLRCWEFGMGREWDGDGKGEVSLRVTWGQGGQDRITPKEGFQVCEREGK